MVNALSEWLTVQVHKNGKIHEMKFARGHVTQYMTVVGETDKTGTVVTFKPDPEMFEDTVYDYEILGAGISQRRSHHRYGGQAARQGAE